MTLSRGDQQSNVCLTHNISPFISQQKCQYILVIVVVII